MGLLTPDTCFVEFGAGRGKLSHWVQLATSGDHGNQYVLVDRANCRRKVSVVCMIALLELFVWTDGYVPQT